MINVHRRYDIKLTKYRFDINEEFATKILLFLKLPFINSVRVRIERLCEWYIVNSEFDKDINDFFHKRLDNSVVTCFISYAKVVIILELCKHLSRYLGREMLFISHLNKVSVCKIMHITVA